MYPEYKKNTTLIDVLAYNQTFVERNRYEVFSGCLSCEHSQRMGPDKH